MKGMGGCWNDALLLKKHHLLLAWLGRPLVLIVIWHFSVPHRRSYCIAINYICHQIKCCWLSVATSYHRLALKSSGFGCTQANFTGHTARIWKRSSCSRSFGKTVTYPIRFVPRRCSRDHCWCFASYMNDSQQTRMSMTTTVARMPIIIGCHTNKSADCGSHLNNPRLLLLLDEGRSFIVRVFFQHRRRTFLQHRELLLFLYG